MDDLFKQRLYDSEVQPPAFVWPAVQQELQKRRRRRVIIWFMTGMVGAGLTGFSLWYGQQNTVNPSVTTGPVATVPAASGNPVASEIVAVAGTNDAPVSDASAPSELVAVAATVAHHQPDISVQNNDTRTAVADMRVLAAAVTPQGMPVDGAVIQPTAADPSIGVPPVVATDQHTTARESVFVPAEPTDWAATALDALQMATLTTLPVDLLRPAIGQPLVATNALPPVRNNRYCYNYVGNDAILMADAYAGVAFAQKQWRANGVAGTVHLDRRNSTERQYLAFNSGVRGTLLWKQRLRISAGLHYDQIVEIFEFSDPFATNIPRREMVVDGRTVEVIDTNNIQYGTFYQKSYNNYGLLDIPLSLGVELRRGRFGLSLNGGLSVNLLFWKNGTVLNETGAPVKLQDDNVYRRQAGLSVMGSAQGFYCLRPNWRLFVEPYHRQVLRSVLADRTTGPQQRYGITGIQIGVTHILN